MSSLINKDTDVIKELLYRIIGENERGGLSQESTCSYPNTEVKPER